jgi:hypothetical protein
MTITAKYFQVNATKVTFKRGGLDGFQWTLEAVKEIELSLRGVGVVPNTGSGAMNCGRSTGSIAADLELEQLIGCLESLNLFAAGSKWQWVSDNPTSLIPALNELVCALENAIKGGALVQDLVEAERLKLVACVVAAAKVIGHDERIDGFLWPEDTEKERLEKIEQLQAAVEGAAAIKDEVLQCRLLDHGAMAAFQVGCKHKGSALQVQYALWLTSAIKELERADGWCLQPGCTSPSDHRIPLPDGTYMRLCAAHQREIELNLKARVPTWTPGTTDFQKAVCRVKACWKQEATNCDFCGDKVVSWQHEGWCCCPTHWLTLFGWIQTRSVGGFPDGLETKDKQGLNQLVQIAMIDKSLRMQVGRVMDSCLCCGTTKKESLTYGGHEELAPVLGNRQGMCNQCRAAAQHLVRDKKPAALAVALNGTAATEWNAVQYMALALRSGVEHIRGWRIGAKWRDPADTTMPPIQSMSISGGLRGASGGLMEVGEDGKVRPSMTEEKRARARYELKKKSWLLADKLMVSRRETTDLAFLTQDEKMQALTQWKVMRHKVVTMCLQCTGQDAKELRGMDTWWQKKMLLPQCAIELQRVMELAAAHITILQLVERLKELTDISKPGSDAALVQLSSQVIDRLKWGQIQVSELAMGLTSIFAIKKGMEAEGERRSAWRMNDKITKTAEQLIEADHKAKAAAAAKAFKNKRGRDGHKPWKPKRQQQPPPFGKGISKAAKKRRRLREARSAGNDKPPPRKTPKIKDKNINKHKDKRCNLCNEMGHIQWRCPRRAELMKNDPDKKE